MEILPPHESHPGSSHVTIAAVSVSGADKIKRKICPRDSSLYGPRTVGCFGLQICLDFAKNIIELRDSRSAQYMRRVRIAQSRPADIPVLRPF